MLRFVAHSVINIKVTTTFSGAYGAQLHRFNWLQFKTYSQQSTSYCSSTSIMECETSNNRRSHMNINNEYEKTIRTLNTLQSNADTIRRSIALNNKQMPLDDMLKYMNRSGLKLETVEKQSIIHVTGTKGKGSTCALTESILRAHGVRTGFFSSPHLVSVTERFRINGEAYPKVKFIKAFWEVYLSLEHAQENPMDMPAYFKFLTILGFHIFIAEKVDVIILEVGIGGELDSTNIIRNTKTVGITSLGLEHTDLLGNTLKEIAWQKAGIIKPRCNVYTSVTQPECLEVIRQRALEKEATLYIVPPFPKYFTNSKVENVLKNLNEVSKLNGSLAIQLANDWLRSNRLGFADFCLPNNTNLTMKVISGLTNCSWPGRCHTLKIYNFVVHLDGAHTEESMRICSKWYAKVTRDNSLPKILIFNTTGNRNSEKLLKILREDTVFDLACFVPNISSGCTTTSDNTSMFGFVEQIKRAKLHANIWESLCAESAGNQEFQNTVHAFGSVIDCIQFMRTHYGSEREIDVLVTGSLHLIGSFLIGLSEYKNRVENP